MNKNQVKILRRIVAFIVPLIVFICSFLLLQSIVGSQPLKHDEAVYLTKARSWIEGTPANEWRTYRPIGSAIAGWFVLIFTSSESGLRMFGVTFGALALTFVYLLFRSISNTWLALGVAIVVGFSPTYLKQSPQFLNDIPAAGLLIGVLWLTWEHYKSDGKNKTVYLAALLAALSLYIRYGVAVSLGSIGLSTLLILAPRFVTRKGVNYSQLSIAVLLFTLFLSPHLLQAFKLEGNPLGILTKAGDASRRPEYLGQAFVDYKDLLLADKLGGRVLDISAGIGVLITFITLFFKKLRQKYEVFPWLGIIALLAILLTGLSTHAETRFIFASLILLSGIGIAGVYLSVSNKSRLVANLLVGVLMLITLYQGINYYKNTDEYFRWSENNLLRNAQVEASGVIADDVSSIQGCAVWATTSRPEISWYSKCNTLSIGEVDRFERGYLIHLRKSHYSIVFTGLNNEQITPDSSDKYGVQLTEIYHSKKLSQTYGELIVYRIDKTEFKTNPSLKIKWQTN